MQRGKQVERLLELLEAAEWEAERFELPPGWKIGRKLIRGYAIDGEGSVNCDDAIAVSVIKGERGAYRLAISISDTGSFLTSDKTPGIEAFARHQGETDYLPGRYRPMIPKPISEDKLSILTGKEDPETPVLTVSLNLMPDGSTSFFSLELNRLLPSSMTFSDIGRLLSGRQGPKKEAKIRQFARVASRLQRHRQNGEGISPTRTPKIAIVDEDGNTKTRPAEQPGEFIVSEFMILANTAIAEFMIVNNIPGLFRNFQFKSEVSQEQLDQIVKGGNLSDMDQIYDRAYYSVNPQGHEALGLPDAYCHFTSPLRRFADFVNHANLVAFLKARAAGQEVVDYPYSNGQLEEIARHLNEIHDAMREQRLEHQRQAARPMGVAALHLAEHQPV
jgi:ribonuclease R